jgi:putative membrane protein
MRTTITSAILAALLAGCAGSGGKSSATRPATGKVAAPGEHDRMWVSTAYQLNLYQTEAGRLAASRATTDRVRNLARMMVRDYSELGEQLETHARQYQLALPDEMDAKHADLLRQLAEVPAGPDFDRSYLNLERRTHIELISLYEDEANKGEFPGARAVAQENLPSLYARQRHIEQLRPGTWTSPAKPTGDESVPREQPAAKDAK